jgi:two-component system NarL family response regulator
VNTVLIVDDHVMFREGMRNIIRHWDDYEVVGEASNGLEACEMSRDLQPDVILMDISMPVMDGIQATKEIASALPTTRIVMLTTSEVEGDLINAIRNGAHGYVLKDMPSKRLHDKLRRMLRGEAPLSGLMAGKVLDGLGRPGSPDQAASESRVPLTEREQQVLEGIVEGLSNHEIADRIFLSENTVKKHIKNIMWKLGLKNRVECAVYAIRNKLVE